MTTIKAERKLPGWIFRILWYVATWCLWYVATFLGALLYFIPVGLVYLLLGLERVSEFTAPMQVLAAILCGAACGSTIGLGQWLVLRRELQRVGWWVAATIAGYASIGLWSLIASAIQPGWFNWAVTLIVNGKMFWLARVGPTEPEWQAASWPPGALALTLLGLVLGIMQWLVLRGRVARSGWWIAINVVGFALAAVLSNTTSAEQAVFASFNLPVIVGATGMAWLLGSKIPNS